MENEVSIFNSTAELIINVADEIILIANKSVSLRKRFVISLSGGQTPSALFELLATEAYRNKIAWDKTFVFWGDERYVPSDDIRNNAHHAKKLLLDKVNIPANNIYAVPVFASPADSANAYEQEIQKFFGIEEMIFDLMLLGLGANGHTASLFPGTSVIYEKKAGVRSIWIEEEKIFRITMTAPLINKSGNIFFLVTGKSKALVLSRVLNKECNPEELPACLINPVNGKLKWFADTEAASGIA